MSISLVYAPLVLISWAVMGKENFEAWSKSIEIGEKLKIKDSKVLEDLVIGSGFNFVNYDTFKKTHIGDHFFLWEERKDGLYLVYSDYADQKVLMSFKKTLELNYGSPIFFDTTPKPKVQKNKLLPTNFLDEKLLLKVLKDYAVEIAYCDDKTIKCNYQNFHFEFIKNENGIYYVNFADADKMALLHEKLIMFDEAYNQNLQTINYQKIKHKLESQQHEIVEEYIDENDDIVIVINA